MSSGPNEPRLMKPRHSDSERVLDGATGDAGLDGYTRLARRHRGDEQSGNGPFYTSYGSDDMQPNVGERDYNRGPRFSEDY